MHVLLLATVLFVVGCVENPLSDGPSNNPAISVALLFEHEGCRVFRFHDAGHYRYFVRCQVADGAALNTYTESRGKNCRHEVQDFAPTVIMGRTK